MIFGHRTLHPGGLNVSARVVNVKIFVLFERKVARAFFSCFQTTDEE